jgi:hypothetical protein
MNASTQHALIESYVLDITRRLPRRMRNDVAFELRALLTESLHDRAADAGRLPDEAMALDIVREFGRPEDVAARYHAPGDPVIPPSQTTGFAWATLIGIALQWATTLPMALSGQLTSAVPESARFTAWWLSYGLGAFWWPGFLVSMMLIAQLVRRAWPTGVSEWKPGGNIDRDHVNRATHMLGLGLGLMGVAIWVVVAWAVTTFDNPFSRALAFAPEFLATRAPVLLVFWTAGITLQVLLIVEGRWRRLTRKIDIVGKVLACVLMLWFILGGRIFVNDAADETAKGFLWLLVLIVAGELAFHAWRLRSRIRAPEVQRG